MEQVTHLSSGTRSRIRSGFAIPNFSQCVEELIVNSVDAGGSRITCEFSVQSLQCKVTDDGEGFSEASLADAGKRYSTSKCSTLRDVQGNLRYYGYRGEALASIAELSEEMEIISRQRGSNLQLKKTVKPQKNQRVIKCSSNSNFEPETSVCFKRLFANLPVRRQGVNRVLEAENVVERVKRISIVHPTISFSVLDIASSSLELKVPKHKNCLERFQFNFGDVEATRYMQNISLACEKDKITLEGGISTHGHENKSMQYIFVNRRPVLRTKIQTEINCLLKRSDISRRLELLADAFSDDGGSSAKVVTTRTYGAYYLNITCPYADYDISFEPEKTLVEFKNWNKVMSCVRTVIDNFLRKNNLYVTATTLESGMEARNTDKFLERPAAGEFFHEGCVLGKAAYGEVSADGKNRVVRAIVVKAEVPLSKEEGGKTSSNCVKDTNWISVFDEKSGKNVFVNTVTGMSSKKKPTEETCCIGPFATGVKRSFFGPHYVTAFAPRSKENREVKSNHGEKSQSSDNVEWKNPAVPIKVDELQKTDGRRFSALFESTMAAVRFDKEIFSKLQVISQLDGKFIVCVTSEILKDVHGENTQRMMILFDQHAVHERIRLENLERELNKEETRSVELSEVIYLQLKDSEVQILTDLTDRFDRIGLKYEKDSAPGIVKIVAAPQTFFRRMTKIRKENQGAAMKLMIQRLVKDEIQIYRDIGRGSTSIPQSIFEGLCSQACHGAIRFGDSLSLSQCQELLYKLSQCQLPFQCAHGRPSLTPITYNVRRREEKKPNLSKIPSSGSITP